MRAASKLALRVALLAMVAGCSGKAAQRREARAAAEEAWDVREKDKVRLQLLANLVSSRSYRPALEMVARLKADGLDGPQLEVLQAEALAGLGLYDEALGILQDRSLARYPQRHRIEGLIHLDQGNPELAAQSFQEALQQGRRRIDTATRASLTNNLGFALASQGEHEQAVDTYRKALRLDPRSARARNNLGFSQAALGKDDAALLTFMAVQNDRQNLPEAKRKANAHYNMGLAQQLRGDEQLAISSFSTALELAPDHGQADTALTQLSPSPSSPDEDN